jgi:hypothetical protein
MYLEDISASPSLNVFVWRTWGAQSSIAGSYPKRKNENSWRLAGKNHRIAVKVRKNRIESCREYEKARSFESGASIVLAELLDF